MPAIAKHAISNRADQLPISVIDCHLGARQDSAFDLEAYAGQRNVFQICDFAPLNSFVISPYRFNEFGAKEPVIGSPFLNILHAFLIGVYGCG